jgi:hypothetical protein
MFGATKAYSEKNSEYYGGLILKQEVSGEAHPANHCFVVGSVLCWAALSAVHGLWHSKWLIEMHNEECEPIFLTFFVTLGVFLLLAARKPIQYRLVIAFAAWHSLAHSATMLIQTVEAYRHGLHGITKM